MIIMGLRMYVRTPGTSLDGFEVSAGVVDEVMYIYKKVYEDLGFANVCGEDTYYSKKVDAAMFSNVIVNFEKYYPKWEKDPDFKRLMHFLRGCETWCRERRTSLELVIA